MKDELKEIAVALCKDEIDYLEISNTIKQYKALAHKVSKLDIKSNDERDNIHFENGMALGTSWAAMCLNDMMRTKIFVKGLFEAVAKHKSENGGITNILYAGTGPFATLILPVLASYSSDEVICTLMEINESSFNHVQDMIKACGFSDHVTKFIQADATRVKLENPESFDIIISETMQRALESEQQVPIVMNLLDQLKEDVILIPEKIDVVACLVDMGKLNESVDESDYCERLGSVVELSKANLKLEAFDCKGENVVHFNEKIFNLKKETIEIFDQLALLTEIQVFGDNWLRPYQSGLTCAKILKELPTKPAVDMQFSMQYLVDDDPKIIVAKVD